MQYRTHDYSLSSPHEPWQPPIAPQPQHQPHGPACLVILVSVCEYSVCVFSVCVCLVCVCVFSVCLVCVCVCSVCVFSVLSVCV